MGRTIRGRERDKSATKKAKEMRKRRRIRSVKNEQYSDKQD